ncbi:MAG: M13 family metallopeptidase [bacterium]
MLILLQALLISSALDLNTIDKTVNPADDFYHYAVGAWVKKAKIPADKPMWGFFVEQSEKNAVILRKILEKEGKRSKIGTLFALGMDEKQRERDGLAPLAAEFKQIDSIRSKSDLWPVIAHLHLYSASPFFSFGPQNDPENSDLMIATLWQGGLGLPDRDYYLDESAAEIRVKYLKHIEKIFSLLGDKKSLAKKNAEIVLGLETDLAKVSMDKVKLRDPRQTFNKRLPSELKSFEKYFALMGCKDLKVINVGQPEFFAGLDGVLEKYSLEEIKTYLRWQLAAGMSPYLSKEYVDADFKFYKQTFLGLQELPPLWKRMVGTVNGLMGEELGKIYVRDNFPPASKEKMLALTSNIIAATRERIKALDWMEEATKNEALKKLDHLRVKIGYPSIWRDYSKLEIKDDSFVANIMRANYFASRRELDKIGKPADREEWHMPPQTVNAYFSPPDNEIVFPAGILQPILFDPKADDAVNYGAIGAVIAHEITHDFDDQGRKYDSKGNLRDWWTEGDDKRFKERAQKLVVQYSSYEVAPGLKVNGELTLGENIADLGGLSIAYTALQNSLKDKAKPTIDGLTPEQRFFFSWAESWKSKTRPEYLSLIVKTNPHSPNEFRVNGVLANMPEFAAAFGIKPGSKMALPADKRAHIW